MNKIIYLIEQPLDERNFNRFGIQNWINRGWGVEVWDLTPCAYPRVWVNFIQSGRKLSEFEGYFPIISKSQLKLRYANLEGFTHFIDETGDNYHSIPVKWHLIKMGGIRTICAVGTIPEVGTVRSSVVCKIRKAAANGPIKAFTWLINVLIRRLAAPSIKPGIVIVSGEKSIPPPSDGFKQEIIKAHNFDYDIFLKLKESVNFPSEEYAVFVDQDFCFHPDFIFQDIPFPTTPEKYFPALTNGLQKISYELGVGLLVAVHPRSTYQQRGSDYFKGIQIEYGKTAALIRNCRVTVCHYSTAIQFAVLFNKSLILFKLCLEKC